MEGDSIVSITHAPPLRWKGRRLYNVDGESLLAFYDGGAGEWVVVIVGDARRTSFDGESSARRYIERRFRYLLDRLVTNRWEPRTFVAER